ncbi:DUF2845 domain-containing protein [Anaeromyxobacter diazotrophicus]|uniref:DUF2845 domain-containing protein n=1 Tax=Anaeromyxobacter diazotrophicus TaxID=2590199 RepID=A0A7I9VS38_9BACT|nr:DUF2845 domain-containing protein [Anaeromyxobacter diazotrophicus]GEJ58879.1 hypothetical protein AMYX_36200 [Anaeromyxobacter diazotrophicus]
MGNRVLRAAPRRLAPNRSRAVRWVISAALALGSAAASADSIDCAGGIVSAGDSRLDLLAKCGPPALQEAEPILVTASGDLSLLLEWWTYNFGPQRFIHVVKLRGGKVLAIERGGYGYELPEPPRGAPRDAAAIPRARCASDALRLGDRTFDVLAKCGEPVFRDLRRRETVIEVWTYDFGPSSFVRYVELEGGRLVRIRTGSYGYSR